MKAMTLEESKKIQVEMLRSLDEFCRKNDIKYSLAYGTLIGAVRHKGFIPWDDDIDVTMERTEFERFISLYKSDKYDLLKPMRSKRWEFFARIVDPNTVVKFDKFPISPFGVWLTIFPVDNRPDDEQEWKKMKAGIDKFATLARFKCATLTRNKLANVLKVISWGLFSILPLKYVNKKVMQNVMKCSDEKTLKKVVWVSFNTYETYPSSIFDDYVDLQFDDIKCMAMKGYDTYLRTAYGDYMKLPPKEQQQPSHDFTAYYINVNR